MPQRSSGHHHSERSGHGLSCFNGILGQAPADARRLQSARTSTTVEDCLRGVIKDISFEIRPGEIVRFPGPNGAGANRSTRQLRYLELGKAAYNAMTMDATDIAPHPPSSPITEMIPAEFLAQLRAHGVTRAYLFGSVVTGCAGPNSDLDVLVFFDYPVPLFDQIRLAEQLGKVCNRSVDLMTDIHPAFSDSIVPTLVRLPL